MSTSNFEFMDYDMPLVCGGMGDFDEYKKAYEESCDGEYTEGMFWTDLDCEYDNAVALADDFTDGLTYHEVTVQSGYYQGFQFMVRETCQMGDLDGNSPYCIDNEDAHYCYGMCRSKVLRAADAEKRKIRKWLKEISRHPLFMELACLGVFSNGEAVYTAV